MIGTLLTTSFVSDLALFLNIILIEFLLFLNVNDSQTFELFTLLPLEFWAISLPNLRFWWIFHQISIF